MDREGDSDSEIDILDVEPADAVLPPLKEQLKPLTLAKQIIVSRADSDYCSLRDVSRAQVSIRLKLSSTAHQTTVNGFFN